MGWSETERNFCDTAESKNSAALHVCTPNRAPNEKRLKLTALGMPLAHGDSAPRSANMEWSETERNFCDTAESKNSAALHVCTPNRAPNEKRLKLMALGMPLAHGDSAPRSANMEWSETERNFCDTAGSKNSAALHVCTPSRAPNEKRLKLTALGMPLAHGDLAPRSANMEWSETERNFCETAGSKNSAALHVCTPNRAPNVKRLKLMALGMPLAHGDSAPRSANMEWRETERNFCDTAESKNSAALHVCTPNRAPNEKRLKLMALGMPLAHGDSAPRSANMGWSETERNFCDTAGSKNSAALHVCTPSRAPNEKRLKLTALGMPLAHGDLAPRSANMEWSETERNFCETAGSKNSAALHVCTPNRAPNVKRLRRERNLLRDFTL